MIDSTLKQEQVGLMDYNSARSLLLFGCLVAAVAVSPAHTQLKVFRGTLVHSRIRTEIEVLEDYLIGIDRDNYGTVSQCRNHGRPSVRETFCKSLHYGINRNKTVNRTITFFAPGEAVQPCHFIVRVNSVSSFQFIVQFASVRSDLVVGNELPGVE